MFAFNLNVWAVLVAALAAFVFGAVYYSKPLFGKKWMEYTEMSEEKDKKEMALSLVGNYLALFVTAVIQANLFLILDLSTVADACLLTFWLWLAFSAMNSLNMIWWDKKPFGLYAMLVVSNLIELLIMASILVTWA